MNKVEEIKDNMNKLDYDDKDLVIIATMILGIMSMFLLEDADNIVGQIVTGMFGIAVGKSLK